MDFLLSIPSYITEYPRGSLLAIVSLLNLGWAFYLVFGKGDFKKTLYKTYLFYSTFILLWVLSNAYFQLPTLTYFGENAATQMGLFSNFASVTAITAFFYISCFLRYSHEKIPFWAWGLILYITVANFAFNYIPYFEVISHSTIYEVAQFQLHFTPWITPYFGSISITILAGLINFILAIKNKRASIENVRFFYIFFGMSLMYVSLFILTMVLPFTLSIYDFVWIPPILSIADVMIFGYAISIKEGDQYKIQRFSDIVTTIFKIIAIGVSLLISISVAAVIETFIEHYFNSEIFYREFIGVAIGVTLYLIIHKSIHDYLFFSLLKKSSLEYFRYRINKLRNKTIVYTNIQELQNDIQKTFSEKLNIPRAKILLADKNTQEQYPYITQYFQKNETSLLLQDIQLGNKENVSKNLIAELQLLGNICIPLYHPSQKLLGFFILGNKASEVPYSTEEIEYIEQIGRHFALVLTGILYHSELQKEVDKKTTELQERNTKIENLLTQQADFLLLSAHELRTPVSVVKTMLEVVKLQELPDKVTGKIHNAYNAINKMKDVVETIMEVQSLDSNSIILDKKDVKISSILEYMKKHFSPIVEDKEIIFNVDSKCRGYTVLADEKRIIQVLRNILLNAKNYTPLHGEIHVSCKHQDDFITVEVADTGPGVPEEIREAIFEKFRSNHVMESPGMGLGLYISRKIIELHKGKIWQKNNDKNGASFFVQLPVK